MKRLKQILCVAFAALFCLCVFTGCGAGGDTVKESETGTNSDSKRTAKTDWDYVQKNGTLVIGITDYKPMNYYDENGTLIGFDTEYAKAVCKNLGITPKFVEINWDNKEIELNAFNIDCIWNGMTYTAERDKNMDFSQKYIHNAIVAVIRKADASKFTSTATLSSATLAAEGGSTAEGVITDDKNLSKATYVPSDTLIASLMEVKAGTADAAIVDSTMAEDLVGTGAYKDLMIIDGLVLSDETLAIGFRTNSSLVAKINEATNALLADGTLQALAEKYQVNLITY